MTMFNGMGLRKMRLEGYRSQRGRGDRAYSERLDWTEREGFSLPAFITGQGLFSKHISYDSSVNVMNLRRIEARLWNLQSPLWPENILPPIDKLVS